MRDSWISFEFEPPDAAEMARRIAEYSVSTPGWLPRPTARSPDTPTARRGVAIYVDSAQARQGIGRALYGALLPLLADICHAAFVGIALPNAASVGLHEEMGFAPVGIYREVGWKMNGWRDVGWWQRLLTSPSGAPPG